MLCLSLKPGECFVMSNGFYFQVDKIQRGTVRFSMKIPSDVRVLRGKLLSPEMCQHIREGTATPDQITAAFTAYDEARARKNANPL